MSLGLYMRWAAVGLLKPPFAQHFTPGLRFAHRPYCYRDSGARRFRCCFLRFLGWNVAPGYGTQSYPSCLFLAYFAAELQLLSPSRPAFESLAYSVASWSVPFQWAPFTWLLALSFEYGAALPQFVLQSGRESRRFCDDGPLAASASQFTRRTWFGSCAPSSVARCTLTTVACAHCLAMPLTWLV